MDVGARVALITLVFGAHISICNIPLFTESAANGAYGRQLVPMHLTVFGGAHSSSLDKPILKSIDWTGNVMMRPQT